jgi:hypothetical protein
MAWAKGIVEVTLGSLPYPSVISEPKAESRLPAFEVCRKAY